MEAKLRKSIKDHSDKEKKNSKANRDLCEKLSASLKTLTATVNGIKAEVS